MHVSQLLVVYNQRFNARTIREHVEHLRRRGFVWWGRFYGGAERFDEAAARAKWPHVAALADERTASGESSLLFVTNYVDLHVCKVSRIALGDAPPGNVRNEALPYYRERSIPMWFRVEDVRALSYDQTMTLDWFENRLGVVKGGSKRPTQAPYTRPYDPYAAVLHEFPIVLEAPSCAELFDHDAPPDGARRWADARDAISSRPVQRAREHLEKSLVPGLWERLNPETKELLANAWVERNRVEHDEDVDPAMGFTRVANAVENELCAELMSALEGLRDRLKAKGAPEHAALDEHIEEARPRDSNGKPGKWMMGPSLQVLRRLVNRSRRDLERLGLAAVVRLAMNLRWLEEMRELRNPASHYGNDEEKKGAQRGALKAFFEDRGKGLVAVVEARDIAAGWR